ncbi:LRR receptor-like serine/threonine-protein kinase RCH1 [Papaver somniferum]|uniref:LRR receptor-like serine/threonine-protein kinase RCH1 n=1 Tax=Papaver somniferum TaxID=3469 RepID=UPI000E6FC81B|nr:LRR receptor-like serine/threonine-protein kinase RCH1 [Papaver somniferum]
MVVSPLLPESIYTVDVSNNQFGGEIAIQTGKRLTSCEYINLSGNKFSGPSLSSLCLTDPGGYARVGLMDLSSNLLSGVIPASIGQCKNLYSLNLGNNNLTGNISNELELASLASLQLNGNNLDGTLDIIGKLHKLEALNLADNNFGGSIPTGLGSLHDLKILSLRSNKLRGSIPQGIVHLQELQILDLPMNNISRPIPREMRNLKRLLSRPNDTLLVNIYDNDPLQLQMVIKGIMLQFEQLHSYSSGIDLSCNILDGNIPEQIGTLKALGVLNLSHNCISGSIPTSVGEMVGLESLDISSNRLSGHIPQSLTGIDWLQFLNVSYNKLNGRIPRGVHFDTLSLGGLAFVGNDLLCGYPTEKICEGDRNTSTSDANLTNEFDEIDADDDTKEKLLLYAIVALGFAVGFWGLFFVLLLKKQNWWFPYWRLVDSFVIRIID